MESHVGFDIHPPLTRDFRDQWIRFLKDIWELYKEDPMVVKKVDRLVFLQMGGERPTHLYFSVAKNLCFSFKRTTSRMADMDKCIRAVEAVAQRHFPDRIHPWGREEDDKPGQMKYEWQQVYNAARNKTDDNDLFLLNDDTGRRPSFLRFSDCCWKVLHAFERVHVGMNGLKFVSASFPPNAGFQVVQRDCGSMLKQLTSIEDWTSSKKQAEESSTKKAYWIARCQNNCETLNHTFRDYACGSRKDILIVLDEASSDLEGIHISSVSTRQIGVPPRHVGILVEPPFESRIPPSPDGETFHTFAVGRSTDNKLYALDCSCAQFGIFGGQDAELPFIACELTSYLKRLGSTRVLKRYEMTDIHPFVQEKVKNCLKRIGRK